MYRLWFDTMMLGLEAQQVIWLRALHLARGGKAGEREARRMVTEKVIAATQAAGAIAAGAGGKDVVRGYRRKVRANRRRLSR
ncbi:MULTISPECIES: hypothetical protein [unclassified Mesorhizobium]|uniref:hypothetical protein n=1 Tax=unclassified Mesorhizobium TaxID=325217 RepID=UPI001925636B|nr:MULTISPECIES: hypothetical protein [unclassified Mesorhizobium]BCH22444.1 hypothetical protein MesoLjLb_22290 [Mesorhizobium sp. L-8-3]